MQINSYELKPILATIIKADERMFYAASKGVRIVEWNSIGINILYAEETDNLWGAFHFSAVFHESIFFFPRNYDYVIKYDIIQKQTEKIAVPGKQNEEFMLPYINNDAFMMIGLSSGNVYKWVDECAFEKVSQLDWGCEQWKLNKQGARIENILFWNTDKEIAILDKENLMIKRIVISTDEILYAAGDERHLFWVSESGDVYSQYDKFGDFNYLFHLEFPVSDLARFIYREHSLYLLPHTGNQIYVIKENSEASVVNLELDLKDKNVNWAVCEDGFIGVAENIDKPWNGELTFFTYNPSGHIVLKLPFEEAAMKYLFHKNIKNGILIREGENNDLKTYLKLVKGS